MFVRNCFYMKKIPQRRLEKKIKDLEIEIENY
jgi:hypothetical protein